jgi:predicted transcriptional regulator
MRGFGDLEAVLMDRLWSRDEPTTIRELVDELRQEREPGLTGQLVVLA